MVSPVLSCSMVVEVSATPIS